MNRRGFLRALAGGAIAVAIPKLAFDFVPQLVKEPALSLQDIISTTLRARSAEIAANITASNTLLNHLKRSGVVRPWSGGLEVASVEWEQI